MKTLINKIKSALIVFGANARASIKDIIEIIPGLFYLLVVYAFIMFSVSIPLLIIFALVKYIMS